MKKIFYILAFICFYTLVYAQTPPFQTSIFIHTSKPFYLPGEKIWLSAYLINTSTNELLEHKHPLYVQLYAPDGELIITQIIYTESGRGSGTLSLSPLIPVGIYRLQAFTQSMVFAKQANYEQRIFVGINPIIEELTTETEDSEFLIIVADSAAYSQRSPVQILLQPEPNLKATVSISVYKEPSFVPSNRFILPAKNLNINTPEPVEELLYMGRVVRANGTAVVNGQVILSMNLPNGQKTFVADTDSTGFFIFKDLGFEGEQTAYWQINNSKGKVVSDAVIHWIKFPSIPTKIDSLPIIKEKLKIIQQPAVYVSDGDTLGIDSKMLEEVIVKAKRTEVPEYLRAMLHKEEDVSFAVDFENDQLPNIGEGTDHNFYKMLKRLPPCPPADPPIYLIDGMKLFANSRPEDVVNTRQIKRIELLRGASGAIYGGTCVYAIYTFGVESKAKKVSTPAKTVKLNGYQATKAFYSPNYANKVSHEQDNRQTLYWNPSLVLEPNQKDIPILFFTSDVSGTYRVVVHGMSNYGAINAETVFLVK